MEKLEKIFKALADKNRIRILKLLEKKKMCVCEIAFALRMTQPNISKHLKKLKQAGIISDEQKGFWTNYFLSKADSNQYNKILKANLRGWLNDNRIIKGDLKKVKNIDRAKLCCK
jgi:ArsR family transcriptional regulator, arsenate/arsenite/antimonite-responsive transcriptional repressor